MQFHHQNTLAKEWSRNWGIWLYYKPVSKSVGVCVCVCVACVHVCGWVNTHMCVPVLFVDHLLFPAVVQSTKTLHFLLVQLDYSSDVTWQRTKNNKNFKNHYIYKHNSNLCTSVNKWIRLAEKRSGFLETCLEIDSQYFNACSRDGKVTHK